MKFDWNRARAFLVTAEEGSLSAAARALGLAQPTLGRQVAALEEELGVVLFQRAGRALRLTPGGRDLLDHVRAMGDAAGRVSLAAGGHSQAVEGTVAIASSEIYAFHLLPPIVEKLRLRAPGIEVEIVASNSAADLTRGEADIAIRGFRPTQPDLVARRIRDDRARLYAAERYLERIGNPSHPEDLANADFIAFDTPGVMIEGLRGIGLELEERNFPLRTANHLVQWQLVRQGVGIGIFPETFGDAEPTVRRVLPTLDPLVFPIWLTAHREVSTSRRIRLVFDLLAEELAKPS